MILTRTPFRVSFVGGGSDLESYYRHSYGAVVSTTIDKYMYIAIHPYFHDKLRIKYSRTEDVDRVDEIQHPIVRECLRLKGISRGLEIASIADVPAGTGVGSSSSFTVGLLHALSTLDKTFVSKECLARNACQIEIEILREPIGKQDQYAASYGGLNYIQFNKDGSVLVDPVPLDVATRHELACRLLLFYLGGERRASDILTQQKANMADPAMRQKIDQMVLLATNLRIALQQGCIEALGTALHKGWLLKKGLAGNVSSPEIDRIYEKALDAGATGGKVLGAGCGGFLLLYCEPERQERVKKTLNLRHLSFQLDGEGSKIVYYDM